MFAHVKQNVDDPAQVPQEESQAVEDQRRQGSSPSDTIVNNKLTCASNVVLRIKERAGRATLNTLAFRQHESREATTALHLIYRRRDVEGRVLAGRALRRACYTTDRSSEYATKTRQALNTTHNHTRACCYPPPERSRHRPRFHRCQRSCHSECTFPHHRRYSRWMSSQNKSGREASMAGRSYHR